MRARRTAFVIAATMALLVGLAGCEFRRGPDPTRAALDAPAGPLAIASAVVPSGHGFGGGTIYYPTTTSLGTFGAVAVVPGYTATQSSISWYGPRVASHGFVVITIDTTSIYDSPTTRGRELLAALDYLTSASDVASRIDRNRTAVMGWSMGGGGALYAARDRPSLKASIPLAPWARETVWSSVTVPTLIVGCQADTTAPVATYALPYYADVPTTTHKAYEEIQGGSHSCVTSPSASIGRNVVAWLKRFVDGDTRYTQFLCPPVSDPAESAHETTCPYS